MIVRPVIALHSCGINGLGGPMTGAVRIMKSELAAKYRFEACHQTRPAGGINVRLIREMADRLRAIQPDLVHVCGLGNEGFHGLVAGRVAGCRRILVSVHGTQRDCRPSWRQWVVSRLLEPYTLRHADGVYCVCAYAAGRNVIKRHARRMFGYIHNALDVLPRVSGDSGLRASFGFVDADRVAVFVGRLSVEKGLLDLCTALRLLAARGEDRLRVLVVGDGPDRLQIETAAARLPSGRVVFAGQRDDVFEIMQASDFLVLPSLHENLPQVLLEAMACGRAVVATNVGGIPEVVVPGETGILVPRSDASALADAMQLLGRDPERCAVYGEAGRRRAESCFSMRTFVASLDRVYQLSLEV